MKHPWRFKKIGTVPDNIISELQKTIIGLDYMSYSDFPQPNSKNSVTKEGQVTDIIYLEKKKLLLDELAKYFNLDCHVLTDAVQLHPYSYIPEHSDFQGINRPSKIILRMVKIQIPIITNDKNSMIWIEDDGQTTITNFKQGGIYIIDNITRHCAINLSDESRYYITSRFMVNGVLDPTILT